MKKTEEFSPLGMLKNLFTKIPKRYLLIFPPFVFGLVVYLLSWEEVFLFVLFYSEVFILFGIFLSLFILGFLVSRLGAFPPLSIDFFKVLSNVFLFVFSLLVFISPFVMRYLVSVGLEARDCKFKEAILVLKKKKEFFWRPGIEIVRCYLTEREIEGKEEKLVRVTYDHIGLFKREFGTYPSYWAVVKDGRVFDFFFSRDESADVFGIIAKRYGGWCDYGDYHEDPNLRNKDYIALRKDGYVAIFPFENFSTEERLRRKLEERYDLAVEENPLVCHLDGELVVPVVGDPDFSDLTVDLLPLPGYTPLSGEEIIIKYCLERSFPNPTSRAECISLIAKEKEDPHLCDYLNKVERSPYITWEDCLSFP